MNKTLKLIMVRSFKEAWEMAQAEGVSLRLSALMLAVRRVAEAIRSRGIFP